MLLWDPALLQKFALEKDSMEGGKLKICEAESKGLFKLTLPQWNPFPRQTFKSREGFKIILFGKIYHFCGCESL